MKTFTFWESTSKLAIAAILYFILTLTYWYRRAPELIASTSLLLIIAILGFTLLQTLFKKPSRNIVGLFFLSYVVLIVISVLIHNEYFVENFELFQPYLGMKLLALSIALSAPPKLWVGWLSLFIVAVTPLVQYYSWPTVYRSELGFQEPQMTLAFVIIAATLYVNRLHTLKLLKKEVIAKEKLVFIQRLGSLMVGLQHLNNTPLQTIEVSLQLLRAKCPECNSIIEGIERSYQSVVRVNKLLATGSYSVSKNSASTIEEFEQDVQDIGTYLKT